MAKKPKMRTERDALGTMEVPKDAYYGIFTARALQNFKISGIPAHPTFRKALAYVKIAAAATNGELGELNIKHTNAIIKAAYEFIDGKFDDQYMIDVFQAGAGTPFNMNLNEILANRANEILKKGKKGSYKPITPNNHANWGQSSNDTIPTAIRIAAIIEAKRLLEEITQLEKSFAKKAKQFEKILKVGRTHLQDAVPITLGQEFDAYTEAIRKSKEKIAQAIDHLRELPIGGTALGTGITTHPKYRQLVVKNLSEIAGEKLKPTKHPMELTHNMNDFATVSAALRSLANDYIRISKDLRILASGPKAGINEIQLPEVEPGSSIMPGKINPSVPECVTMIGLQVLGNDHTINLSVQNSELELNTMTPLIMMNLLWSIGILRTGSEVWRTDCIDGIQANKKQCAQHLNNSLALATALSPYLGYKVTAELVNEALQTDQSLKKTVQSHEFMKEAELNTILHAEKLTKPAATDQKLKKRIEKNRHYKKYLKKIST